MEKNFFFFLVKLFEESKHLILHFFPCVEKTKYFKTNHILLHTHIDKNR